METMGKQSFHIPGAEKSDNTTTPPIVPLDDHQKGIIRKALVAVARSLLGVPYVYGSEWSNLSIKPFALDCSEMIKGIYILNGLKMPDGSQSQFDYTLPTGIPQPADLAFFGRGGNIAKVYHVGMVFDEGTIIEAREHDPKASFETGKVIFRPRQAWENYCNFLGYRVHPKLV